MVPTNPDLRVPAAAPRKRAVWRLASSAGIKAILLAAAPLAIAVGLLAAEERFELGSGFIVAVLVAAFAVVMAMLALGLRDLHAADARTTAALERAATAETIQRARADELARLIKAGETLALSGEGQMGFLDVLESITPDGVTSFLVKVQEDDQATVVAAHGPLAGSVFGVRRPLPLAGAGGGEAAPSVASYSASGHWVGVAMTREHFASLDSDIQAALTVPMVDHGGCRLGWLHMLDQRNERILEPTFVNLAQLVASQIAVAMENADLLARVRHQLIEVQRVQQQLIQASKLGAIGELAAAVAHEVNNPLTGILGFAELLMADLPAEDPRHDEAVVIRDEAVRARSIVRALLEFARPRPPQRIPSDVNDLARSTLELVRYRATEADVRVIAEYGELPRLEVDPDAFRQVLLNLFNNAIDAMPRGGDLRLTTVAEQDRVGVVVADGGVGMDEDTRHRIFTPFFTTRGGTAGGSGLGLSVSRQIVESHGGTIEVESTPGQGSKFTVWLPSTWAAFEGEVLVPGTVSADTRNESLSGAEAGPSTESRETAA
jgi:signal transduction histidine kinase